MNDLTNVFCADSKFMFVSLNTVPLETSKQLNHITLHHNLTACCKRLFITELEIFCTKFAIQLQEFKEVESLLKSWALSDDTQI